MGHITTENAQQELERLQQEMREETTAYVAGLTPTDPDEGHAAGAEAVNPPEPEPSPEGEPRTPEGEAAPPNPEPSPEPKPEEDASQKPKEKPEAAPADSESPEATLASLKAKLDQVEKSYKAIQSAITPTQQQRAALRKENAALRKELAAMKGTGEEHSLKEQLDHLEGVLPEGRAALEQIIDRQDRLDAQIQDAETRHRDAVAKATWDSILATRPNVSEYSKPEHPLWGWIDQQPEGQLYREVLADPAGFQNGGAAFNAILDAYEAQGHPAAKPAPIVPPATTQSRPAPAPAVPAPKPTDVGAPTRTAPPSRPAATAQRTRELTDADYAAMERELRTAKPERALEIVQLLRKR